MEVESRKEDGFPLQTGGLSRFHVGESECARCETEEIGFVEYLFLDSRRSAMAPNGWNEPQKGEKGLSRRTHDACKYN